MAHVRLLSVIAIGLFAASCASEGVDEEAKDVYVSLSTSGGLGCSHVVPQFSNPDGSGVQANGHGAGLWSAPVLAGGTVEATLTCNSSPSSSSSRSTKIVGVEPGDNLTMFVQRAALPADCVRRTVDLITDSAGSHWDDPSAASVNARVIVVEQSGSMPFMTSRTSTIIDGDTATTIPYRTDNSGQVPPTTVSVDVISCTNSDYAALRPLL